MRPQTPIYFVRDPIYFVRAKDIRMRLSGYCLCLAAALAPGLAWAGTFKTLYAFGGANDGVGPMAPLTAGNGALYGTTFRGGPNGAGTVFTLNLQTGVESVLTSMVSLTATPVLLVKKTLYGTTTAGDNGQGTIFDTTLKNGATNTLYGFPRGRDQAYPSGLVKIGGSLYGVTYNGGNFDGGSVFAYDLKTTVLTTLYSFTGGADGAHPVQVVAEKGLLYGVASKGGESGEGAIFKIALPSGAETVLHSFSGTTDGSGPNGIGFDKGLIYGAASFGGANNDGTLFSLDPSTEKLTVLYTLVGGADGCLPVGPPAIIKHRLYSVAASCGSDANQGALFDVDMPTGVEKTLHVFSNGNDGVSPLGALLLSGGVLYGTASYGGVNNAGTIFEYVP